jgi:hypothetical protein
MRRTNIVPVKFYMFLYLLLMCIISSVPLVMAVEIGDKAPGFDLPSTTGETISLNQFKGKKNVLIQFYTLDFNPV